MTRGGAAKPRGARDLLREPVGRTLFLFALPVMAANVLQQANVVANTIWIGRTLGPEGVAAAFNANLLLAFLLGCISGPATAASILVGRALGARDLAQARRVGGSTTLLFVLGSAALAIAGIWLAAPVLALLGTPAAVRSDAIGYLRVIFCAIPPMFYLSYLQMAQRAAGDARTPLQFSLVAVVIDIVLNPLLILGVGPFPRMGVAGSAMATLLAQTICVAGLVWLLYRRRSVLIPRLSAPRDLRPDPGVLRYLVVKGVPMGLTMIVVTGAALAMINLVNGYGVATAAAYGAATQLWVYVQMPGAAVGVAVTAMAAQAIGAGRRERIGEIVRHGIAVGFLVTFVPVALIYLANRQVMSTFLPAGEALAIAQQVNNHALWGFLLFSISIVMTSVLRAAGAVLVPLIYTFTAMWIVRVPAAAIAARTYGAEAIWWSFPLASLAMLIFAGLYYRYGRWRPISAPGSGSWDGRAAD